MATLSNWLKIKHFSIAIKTGTSLKYLIPVFCTLAGGSSPSELFPLNPGGGSETPAL